MAVDGSESSDKALDFALDLAEKFSSAITILNVSESLSVTAVPKEYVTNPGGNAVVFDKDFIKIHGKILDRSFARARAAKPELRISYVLREGDPAHEIVDFAKQGGFDAVAVGHKGLGKMEELFLGSTSEKVARLAPCSVIIVK